MPQSPEPIQPARRLRGTGLAVVCSRHTEIEAPELRTLSVTFHPLQTKTLVPLGEAGFLLPPGDGVPVQVVGDVPVSLGVTEVAVEQLTKRRPRKAHAGEECGPRRRDHRPVIARAGRGALGQVHLRRRVVVRLDHARDIGRLLLRHREDRETGLHREPAQPCDDRCAAADETPPRRPLIPIDLLAAPGSLAAFELLA